SCRCRDGMLATNDPAWRPQMSRFIPPTWRRATSRRTPRCVLSLEALEDRAVPAVVTVQAGTTVRTVNEHVLGTNLAEFDAYLNTATQQLVQSVGQKMLRWPGGGVA